MLYAVHKFILVHTTSGFELSLVIWWVLDLFCFRHLLALSYSGKVTKAFPLTPSGYEMAAKEWPWGYFYSPNSNTKVNKY